MYARLIRPMLFALSPELAHHFTFQALRVLHRIPGWNFLARRWFGAPAQARPVEVAGLRFPNRIGLAAGFDKDGLLWRELSHYGFGFLELGTVTPRPQPGNPVPRLFRLPADKGLINRMGFNNRGAAALASRLNVAHPGLVLGGNIGKNKNTPNDEALSDYRACLKTLHPVVDYFVVNVSSPNTPNLRALQEKEPLKALLKQLLADNESYAKPRPIFLKIAPDLNAGQLDDILEIVRETGLHGLIATNTTTARAGLKTPAKAVEKMGAGGLSGAPVRARATEVVSYLRDKAGPELPIMAVGGVFTAADAQEKLDAGADLVQVYTGFIYEGPTMVRRILKGLS
jgi:dihydroorotate dehydrogenase